MFNFLKTNPGLEKPKTQLQEVLYMLLATEFVSTKEFMLKANILNCSANVSELRKLGLDITCISVKGRNKFGNVVTWGYYTLTSSREVCVEVYNNLIERTLKNA